MKLHYFTKLDPVDYDYAAQDTMKHLQFKDYKHLKGVSFDEATEEHIAVKIMASMGFIMCLITILFIA